MKDSGFRFNDIKGSIDDIFNNKFDITWAKSYPGSIEYPKILTKLPIEVADDDQTVIYNYNNEFFRSDDFTPIHDSERHILFAGCSQTEGVGAPLDTVWPKLFLRNIKEKTGDIGFYNIARSGYGWQKVITSFITYVEKYGAPEYLFVLLPNLGRFFEWDESSESFVYVQRYPNGGEKSTEQLDESKISKMTFIEKPFEKHEHRRSFIDFSVSWKLFEKYCESINVKMLWASWDYEENKNYDMANMSNNYIHLDSEDLLNFIRNERPDGKLGKFDLARRDGHAGILINEYWAHKFTTEVEAREWL